MSVREKIVVQAKTCAKCHIEKTILDFYPHADRLASYCKECAKEDRRLWYEKHGEKERLREKNKRDKQRGEIDPTFKIHKCNACGLSEPEVHFLLRKVNGLYYKRHLCRTCFNAANRAKPDRKPTEIAKQRSSISKSLKRQKRGNVPAFIVMDSRKSDKKKGRDNDIDVDFVTSLLAEHICTYCGETELRMTLDRVDNALGHTRTNVVPACIRCNGIRANMPYEAWLIIAPSVRCAREEGMFGAWHSRFLRVMPSAPEKMPIVRSFLLDSDQWFEV